MMLAVARTNENARVANGSSVLIAVMVIMILLTMISKIIFIESGPVGAENTQACRFAVGARLVIAATIETLTYVNTVLESFVEVATRVFWRSWRATSFTPCIVRAMKRILLLILCDFDLRNVAALKVLGNRSLRCRCLSVLNTNKNK